MITTGLSLAVLTAAGFYMIYRKLPRRVRKFMQKHALITDSIACLLTYILFGGTLVALFASAWMGLLVSMILALTSNPSTNAMLERFAKQCGNIKDKFLAWAENKANQQQKETQDKSQLKVVGE